MSLRHRRVQGFSLLELILVLVIIGIITAAISVTISDTRVDNLKVESKRLQILVSLALDEAVLTNQELGLVFEQQEYFFVSYQEDTWQLMDSSLSPQFKSRKIPPQAILIRQVSGLYGEQSERKPFESQIEQQEQEQDEQQALYPEVVFLSSAELTPFVLRFGYDDDQPVYMQITATANAEVTLEGPIYEPMNLGWSADE